MSFLFAEDKNIFKKEKIWKKKKKFEEIDSN